jgi:hypothetical protein
LYHSPNTSKINKIESRRFTRAGHVVRIGKKRNAYRILVGDPEGKRLLGTSPGQDCPIGTEFYPLFPIYTGLPRASSACHLLARCFAELLYDPEDGGDTFLRKVGTTQRTTRRHIPEGDTLQSKNYWTRRFQFDPCRMKESSRLVLPRTSCYIYLIW